MTFTLLQLTSALQVRRMCDAAFESSGGDDVEACIDSVPHCVHELTVVLGFNKIESEMLGRWWALEMFYGYDPDDDSFDRYTDVPELGPLCDAALATYEAS